MRHLTIQGDSDGSHFATVIGLPGLHAALADLYVVMRDLQPHRTGPSVALSSAVRAEGRSPQTTHHDVPICQAAADFCSQLGTPAHTAEHDLTAALLAL